jgi:hypothetical protein
MWLIPVHLYVIAMEVAVGEEVPDIRVLPELMVQKDQKDQKVLWVLWGQVLKAPLVRLEHLMESP